MEDNIIYSCDLLGLEGLLIDEASFSNALNRGLKSFEFTNLIYLLLKELKNVCKLEENINKMKNPSIFLLELSTVLKELGCPYRKLMTGPLSLRLQSRWDRLLLVDYLVSELMAARVVTVDCPQYRYGSSVEVIKQESPTARNMMEIIAAMKFKKPPPDITPELLFRKLAYKMKVSIDKEGTQLVGEPLYRKELSNTEWQKLESTFAEMFEEYSLQREHIISRVDHVILELSDKFDAKRDQIQSTYRATREQLRWKPAVELSDFLAARTSLSKVELALNVDIPNILIDMERMLSINVKYEDEHSNPIILANNNVSNQNTVVEVERIYQDKEEMNKVLLKPFSNSSPFENDYKFCKIEDFKKERNKRGKLRKRAKKNCEHINNSGEFSSKLTLQMAENSLNLKRVNTDFTERFEQIPQKRPYLLSSEFPNSIGLNDLSKKQTALSIGVLREDGRAMDKAMGAQVRAKLLSIMEKAIEDNVDSTKLQFATSGLLPEGFFIVTPMTEEARDWLSGCDLGHVDGIPLVVKHLNKSRVSVRLPGRKNEVCPDPFKWIKYQNREKEELNIDQWNLLIRESLPYGEVLVFEVPRETTDAWKNRAIWLNFQSTLVQVQVLYPSVVQEDLRANNCTCLCSCEAKKTFRDVQCQTEPEISVFISSVVLH